MSCPRPTDILRVEAAWRRSAILANGRQEPGGGASTMARRALVVLASAMLVIAPVVAQAQNRDTTVKPRPRTTAPTDSSVPACCRVVRLDSTTAIVTARETATGYTFHFEVKDPKLRRTLKVGDPVWTDFATNAVRLKTMDAAPCCSIVKTVRPRGSSSSGAPPNRR